MLGARDPGSSLQFLPRPKLPLAPIAAVAAPRDVAIDVVCHVELGAFAVRVHQRLRSGQRGRDRGVGRVGQ